MQPGHPEFISGSYVKTFSLFLFTILLRYHTNPLTLDCFALPDSGHTPRNDFEFHPNSISGSKHKDCTIDKELM